MGLLDKLRSLFGGDADADRDRDETTVSVERNGRTEATVQGAEVGDDESEPVAAGSEAAASTGSLVDEGDGAAEPAEAAGEVADEEVAAEGAAERDAEPVVEDPEPVVDDAEPVADDAEPAGDENEAEDAGEDVDAESVDVVKGIGPAYAERLADAGVHSVTDLAAADAATLAAEIGLSEKRVGRWIERAGDR